MGIISGITIDEVVIVEVDDDPSIVGIDAPLSSIALLNNKYQGACWIKTGPSSTDWSILQKSEVGNIVDGGIPFSAYVYYVDGGTLATTQQNSIIGGTP